MEWVTADDLYMSDDAKNGMGMGKAINENRLPDRFSEWQHD